MNCAKYVGEKSTYIQTDRHRLGHGGNGNVFEVMKENSTEELYAIKIYHASINNQIRLKRFCQEIEFLEKVGNYMEGIIPIYDKHFPTARDKRIWYVMPIAENNFLEHYKSLNEKLVAMLALAKTLSKLHMNGYAHRDIKPANILIYLDKPCLCDFGLLWGYGENRLTYVTDRIGPISIMPPELEPVIPDRDIDYTLSDVYLFAKVLWMIIKENNYGFKGSYERSNHIVYLNRDEYNVSTLEPIHELLEQATNANISLRINIDTCIELIEQQLNVIYYEHSEDVSWRMKINQLIYKENTRSVISKHEPIVKEYSDADIILKMLDGVVKNSDIYIQGMGQKTRIEISECERMEDNKFCFKEYINGHISKEYRLNIQKMLYNTYDEKITLILDDYDQKKDEKSNPNTHIVYYLRRNQEILICCPNSIE